MIDILLVEDSPGDVRITQEAFKAFPLENQLHVARDGEEAISFLRRQGKFKGAARPDLILLDLNMPKKNGFEVLSEIKADGDLKRIPVIVVSVTAEQRDIERCYSGHANAFVTKPVNFDRFVDAVRSIGDFWLSYARLPNKPPT